MIIRPATLADARELSSLSRDVQSLHASHHPDIFKMPESEDFAESFFEEMLADPTVRIFLAEEDGEGVGYILCKLINRPETPFTVSQRYLLVDQISVRPAARGRGIGADLLQQAEMLAKEWEVKKIQLDSWDFNLDAHRFFETVGFQKFNYRFWRHL